MPARIAHRSWLNFARLNLVDNVEIWSPPELPEITPQPDDIIHVVETRDRLDTLAVKYYQDHRLDWLIALANGIMDFTVDIVPGAELVIPSPRYILSDYMNRAT